MSGQLPITPIYGWGWSRDDENAIIEVPPPFSIVLELVGPPEWRGTVATVGHEFDGRKVWLSKRHKDWDGYFNVQVPRR